MSKSHDRKKESKKSPIEIENKPQQEKIKRTCGKTARRSVSADIKGRDKLNPI